MRTQETLDAENDPLDNALSGLPPGFTLERGSGALSAPPPPGFANGATRPTFYSGAPLNPNAWSSQDSRTMSFTNLAAVIGTGLAESMDDSTKDAHRDSLFGQDLSYARQSRHAASRMIRNANSVVYPGDSSRLSQLSNLPQAKKLSNSSLNASQQSYKHDIHTDDLFSVDPEPLAEFKASTSYRPGGFLSPKDVGVTVMEPMEAGLRSAPPKQSFGDIMHPSAPSRNGTPDLAELRRSMDHMALETEIRQRPMEFIHAEIDLAPFFWDVRTSDPSRSLVILRAFSHPDIRTTCEAFGNLETFRTDFVDKGIIFVGFYDIRSAQYAAMELKSCLLRISGGRIADVDVKYCVPLNSSAAQDESLIVLSDLPANTDEDRLMQMLVSYGSVRSLTRQDGSRYGNGSPSYVVEFHNVQDAKQALLELESTQPWGLDVLLEVGTRSSSDRRKGRDLLALLGRWRHGETPDQSRRSSGESNGHRTPPRGTNLSPGLPNQFNDGIQGQPVRVASRNSSQNPSRSGSPMVSVNDMYTTGTHPSNGKHDVAIGNSSSSLAQQTTQLVIGPDGRYSYVVVNHSAYPQGHLSPQSAHHVDHYGMLHGMPPSSGQQHIMHGPPGSYMAPVGLSAVHGGHANPYSMQLSHNQHVQYISHNPAPPVHHAHAAYHRPGASIAAPTSYQLEHPFNGANAVPFYSHIAPPPTADSSVSAGSDPSPNNAGSARAGTAATNDKDSRHLMLLLDAVDSGRDTRTSLMVRNIPNKYTQQMLLAEFADNGHGPGKIDFFYLPIDFKNKCNRGYAFINFIDFRDIIPFHRQYFGQHWRVFNSDKICDITYARIQGKSGMLKRFENSALMEKDEEYKPLVFGSHGTEKGMRLPFPSTSTS